MFSKPLLVFPPAPDRWSAVAALLTEESPVRRHDLERRLAQGVPEAHDAFALIPDGSKALAVACIRRRGAVGVFGQLYTHPDLRRRGLCRQLVQTLLSWFDMTRGRWLFSHTRTALHADFLTHFDFEPLQQVEHGGEPFVTLLRTPTGVTRDPYARLGSPERGEPHEGEPAGPPVRELSRADWPLVVALLQYRPGPDPRVPLPESALAAENFGLDMFEQRERGAGRVLGAFAGKWLTGVGGLAVAAGGGPTHALIAPHDQPNSELRAALEELARREGHTTVRYPLDALRPAATPEA